MNANRQQLRAFAALGLVMVLWAGNSIVARAVRFDMPPFTLAFLRWAGATLVLAPFAIAPLRRDWRALLAGWKVVLLLGVLGIGAFNALLYSGLQFTTATNALLLQAAIPAVVVVLDRVLFGVRSSLWQSVGVGCSILGVVAIVFEGDPGAAMRLHFGLGDVLILLAVVVWAIYTVFLRQRPKVSPVSFVAATFFLGVMAMAPLAVWEQAHGAQIHWNAGVWAAIAYVALLPSLLSYFIFNWAAGVVGPARAGQAITMMPLFGALMSAALLGERLQPYHFAGMALIVAGIALSALAHRALAR
ncbi:MAG: hypothetical protein RLZZ08_653 [Pseudomonadota bacterium]|jgi:drug/metabolite transporter (DMT)-like permease